MANPKELTFKLLAIPLVLETSGTDKVSITVDLPPPFPPEVSDDPLHITFETAKGRAVPYLRDVLGFKTVEAIDIRTGQRRAIVFEVDHTEPIPDRIPHEPKTRP